jgi:hypothetical protein
VAVIDDVLFVRLELDLMNGSEAVEGQLSGPADLQNKKPLAAQQTAREALHLAFDLHPFRAGQKSVLLHHIFINAVKIQQHNLPGHRRSQEDFTRSTSSPERLKEKLLAAQHLARQRPQEAALHLAFDIDRRRGRHHRTGLSLHRLAFIQIDTHHRKGTGIQNLALHRMLPS